MRPINAVRIVVALLLALLANVAVLVHAVVPHHHHNSVFTALISTFSPNVQQKFCHNHQFFSHRHAEAVGWISCKFELVQVCSEGISSELPHFSANNHVLAATLQEVFTISVPPNCVDESCVELSAHLRSVPTSILSLRGPPCLYS